MKSKLFYKIFLITFFIVLLCTMNIKCAKTKDVMPIDNTIDSTANTDTIYYGFVLNEVLYDPPADNLGDANGDGNRHFDEDEFVNKSIKKINKKVIFIGHLLRFEKGRNVEFLINAFKDIRLQE